MNIKSIIIEELKRLFEQQMYSIPELSKLLGRQGHDENSVKVLEKYLHNAYQKNGDQGVIDAYAEITGVQIEAIRQGRYMFANLYTPEDHEGYIE